MEISRHLIAADRFMDRYGLSCINNFVNSISKVCIALYRCCVRSPLLEDSKRSPRNHYWTYIEQKDAVKCGLGLIPLFGSLLIRAKQYHDDNVATDKTDASLWRNANYAIAKVSDDINNLEYVSMELLYDPEFIGKLLEIDWSSTNEEDASKLLATKEEGAAIEEVYEKLAALGIDKDYIFACEKKLYEKKHSCA